MTGLLFLSIPSWFPLHCLETSGGYKLKCKDEVFPCHQNKLKSRFALRPYQFLTNSSLWGRNIILSTGYIQICNVNRFTPEILVLSTPLLFQRLLYLLGPSRANLSIRLIQPHIKYQPESM